jgi:N-dimethylarginine dimethylaminohydrolase
MDDRNTRRASGASFGSLCSPPPEPIRVNVRSETDALKTVIMCWANPFRHTWSMISSLSDPSAREQLRHNRFKDYHYERVREQQKRFVQALRDSGVTVLFLDNVPGINSQHFTRDIAFCIDEALFVARMGTQYRELELQALEPLLPRFSKVVRLEQGRIEGGDVMLYHDKALVGLGEATDTHGVEALRRKLAELGNPREVVPIPFTHRGVIHLDTKFNIVGKNVALFRRESFQPETIRWFESHFDLIEATDQETQEMAINTLAIGGGKVIMLETSERLAKEVQRRGLTPILLDYSAVTHWPGSFRCTTLPAVGAA